MSQGERWLSPVLRAGLECNDAVRSDGRIVGGNPLDRALWEASDAARLAPQDVERLAALPFDYERRVATVVASLNTVKTG